MQKKRNSWIDWWKKIRFDVSAAKQSYTFALVNYSTVLAVTPWDLFVDLCMHKHTYINQTQLKSPQRHTKSPLISGKNRFLIIYVLQFRLVCVCVSHLVSYTENTNNNEYWTRRFLSQHVILWTVIVLLKCDCYLCENNTDTLTQRHRDTKFNINPFDINKMTVVSILFCSFFSFFLNESSESFIILWKKWSTVLVRLKYT